MKKWFWTVPVLAGLLVGCATVPPPADVHQDSQATRPVSPGAAAPAPAAEKPSLLRTFAPIVTSGKTRGDGLVVSWNRRNPVYRPEKKTAVLAGAYFLQDLGLGDLAPAQKARLTALFFRELPTGGEVKEIVLPRLGSGGQGSGERDGYFFLFQTQDDSGPVFKIETNLPLTPGTHNLAVDLKGNFVRGEIPPWTAQCFLRFRDTLVRYEGLSLPGAGAPLLYRDDEVKPDRSLKTVFDGSVGWTNHRNSMIDVVSKAEALLATGPDPESRKGLLSLETAALATEAFYDFLMGEGDRAVAALGRSGNLGASQGQDRENMRNLTQVLRAALEMDRELKEW